ncbi:pyrroloquinoline quinone biosynthesis peptide chaperone PqqD [Mesorhizobium sp. M1050]|uniref:pyrroloquinoline quinone biosynthesis peptide chaperone PqqD n=1 Tax=unclassified Mesorhizobium TaxID=325217 RepID=UPI0003CF5297|nr:pyrroloquinoline quinone biosynthesis peptide chaperone PqqD [Mesorhizobium sp. LNHC252B00]ESY73885.1 coenzyme PQQ biosynthesis protein D [Mesorhizobium sp. LNHC252B00]
MTVDRPRAFVSRQSLPRLAPYVRLRFDPVRHAWAVLSPERVFWPDAIGLDILQRCDGKTPFSVMVMSLALEYDADGGEIDRDVGAFLQQWADRLLVRL